LLLASSCSFLLHVVVNFICIFLVSPQLFLFSTLPKLCYSFCGQRSVYPAFLKNFISIDFSSFLPFVWGFSYNLCKDITRFPVRSAAVWTAVTIYVTISLYSLYGLLPFGRQLPSNCVVKFNVVRNRCNWLSTKNCRKIITVAICPSVIFLQHISEYEGHVQEEFSYKAIQTVVTSLTTFCHKCIAFELNSSWIWLSKSEIFCQNIAKLKTTIYNYMCYWLEQTISSFQDHLMY
jgi:hypothetical protein